MEVMSGRVERKRSIRICTSRECALGSLKYLGYVRYTAGHIKHQIVSHFVDVLPKMLVDMIA